MDSFQVTPLFLFAALYEKPSVVPETRPNKPPRFGPCLCPPPFSATWHCAHLVLKIFAPASTRSASRAREREGQSLSHPLERMHSSCTTQPRERSRAVAP